VDVGSRALMPGERVDISGYLSRSSPFSSDESGRSSFIRPRSVGMFGQDRLS
jgi:hypothetical protein